METRQVSEDTRNVIDYYKSWETEAIKADLDTKRTILITLFINLSGDFNKSSVVRSGNAFGVAKTIIAGKKKWDRRGAVGTHHYEHVEYWDDPIAAIDWYRTELYSVIPVDNTEPFHPVPLYTSSSGVLYVFPQKTMFVYGEEQAGLSKEVIEACDNAPIYIPQYGSTRSINVAAAASIMMAFYDFQWGFKRSNGG